MAAKKTYRRRPRARKSRVPKSLAMKPYNFTFKLPSQVFTSNASLGQLDASVAAANGPAPLANTKRNIYPSSNGLPNMYDIGFATTFSLADIYNAAAWIPLFDAYKLNSVKCSIEYLNNTSNVNTQGLMPSVYLYWDQDDATIPTSAINIQQKQGMKRLQFGNKMRTSISTTGRPKLTTSTNIAGGTTTGAIVQRSQYLDCVNNTVQHYALKMLITDVFLPGTTAVTQAFRFNWTYNVSFRSPILAA
ncbi:Cap [Chicken proventriculitis-associated circular virus 2]|nr:Cap [Chicken proventriculitis-associated circular virus 2]